MSAQHTPVNIVLTEAERAGLLTLLDEGAEALLTLPYSHVTGYFSSPAQRTAANRAFLKLRLAIFEPAGRTR